MGCRASDWDDAPCSRSEIIILNGDIARLSRSEKNTGRVRLAIPAIDELIFGDGYVRRVVDTQCEAVDGTALLEPVADMNVDASIILLGVANEHLPQISRPAIATYGNPAARIQADAGPAIGADIVFDQDIHVRHLG